MPEYANDAYLRSLASSSSDVTRQAGNALAEIARQRATAQAQAGKIPGATTPIFQEGRGRLSGDLASLGLGSQLSEGVGGAFDTTQGSYGRIAGLLQQGFGERETRQKGAVNNLQSQIASELQMKAAEYASRRAMEDQQRQFASAQQAAEIAAREAEAQRQMDWENSILEQILAESLGPAPLPGRPMKGAF